LHDVDTALSRYDLVPWPPDGWQRIDSLRRWIVKKIMAIEDDLSVLEFVGTLLSEAGYQAILIPNSDRIPERVMREKPDLILLDIVLQPAHGMEVLAGLSRLQHRPPVIMMSAAVKGVDDMVDIAKALGAEDFIEKPFEITDLLTRIERVLDKKVAS
jgi:DNA-binding response OmpR family regulator